MKKRLISTLLVSILAIGAMPIGVSAEWQKDPRGQWSFTDSKNVKVTSWNKIEGSWYYFDNNGNMKTGWMEYGGQWYYLDESGVMQKSWVKSDGKWYHLSDVGVMDTDKFVDGYYLGEDGIMQDISKNKVLFENQYAKVTYIGINRDSKLGPNLKVAIENRTNETVCIQTKDDFSVDGTKKNATLSEEIAPQSKKIASIILPAGTDKNFKNIKGRISIISVDNWQLIKTEEISIDF